VAFSSAMHADLDAGVAAFASVNASLQGYRPNPVAAYALAVLRAAAEGKPLPAAPPPAADPHQIPNAADYAGTYTAADGRKLTLAAEGQLVKLVLPTERVALETLGPDGFQVPHPNFARFPLLFGREKDAVVEVIHGGDWYAGERYTGPRTFDTPAEWQAYAGHYRNENPWEGSFRVVLSKGRLSIGGGDPLVPLGNGVFRAGEEEHVPDRIRFADVVNGRALRAFISGSEYTRIET
jgi:hypothetical protein